MQIILIAPDDACALAVVAVVLEEAAAAALRAARAQHNIPARVLHGGNELNLVAKPTARILCSSKELKDIG